MNNYVITADIHVCIKKDIPESWQINRYKKLFCTLKEACGKNNATLIITGDLFDKSHPTLQELKIVLDFFNDLESAEISTLIVAGNHETIARETNTFKYLRSINYDYIDIIDSGVLKDKKHNVALHLLSHSHLPQDVAKYVDEVERFIDDSGVDQHILITHFRTTVGEYVREEIDTKQLCSPFCMVISGDIHSEFEEGNLVYVNQPINTAFASIVKTGYLTLSVTEHGSTWNRVLTKLPSLIQWTRDASDLGQLQEDIEAHLTKNMEEMNGATDFIKVNLTGTLKELRGIENKNECVKINKIPVVEDTLVEDVKATDTMEQMTTDMQLVEYLKQIPYTDENINSLLEIWKEVV